MATMHRQHLGIQWRLLPVLMLLAWRTWGEPAPSTTNALAHYRFKETSIVEELDSHGKVKSTKTEVKEVAPVEGYLFAWVVSRNGKPLPASEAEKEARRLETFRASIRQGKRPKEAGEVFNSVSKEFSDIQDGAVQEGAAFEQSGNEVIRDRNCLVYSFWPRKRSDTNQPTAKVESPAKGKESEVKARHEFGRELMKSVRGKIWMDAEDKSPARLELKLERPKRFAWYTITLKKLDLQVDLKRLEPKLWTPQEAIAEISISALWSSSHNWRYTMTREGFKDTRAQTIP